jgi:large subunit ribosomal protein L17
MRHHIDGRKFGRNTSHRVAMFRNMANCVIEKEQIVTTIQKAKEVRRVVDRLITLGKSGSPASRRLAFDRTRSNLVVSKLFTALAQRYQNRAGGYTRVLKMADRRWGDAAEMAVLELVDHPELNRKKKPKAEGADSAKKAEASAKTETPKDPFNRFRRLFNPKSKVFGGQSSGPGMKGGPKGGAARKTPAGGGSSKSGGSS